MILFLHCSYLFMSLFIYLYLVLFLFISSSSPTLVPMSFPLSVCWISRGICVSCVFLLVNKAKMLHFMPLCCRKRDRKSQGRRICSVEWVLSVSSVSSSTEKRNCRRLKTTTPRQSRICQRLRTHTHRSTKAAPADRGAEQAHRQSKVHAGQQSTAVGACAKTSLQEDHSE